MNILCAEFKTVTVSHCSQRRGAFRQNYFEAQVQKELHKHLYLVLFSFLPKDSVHEVIKTDSCAIISIDKPLLRVEAFLSLRFTASSYSPGRSRSEGTTLLV